MISLRLLPELEAQLHHLSVSTAVSKNAIITTAVAEYFKTLELGSLPLQGQVQEHGGHQLFKFREKERIEQQQQVHQIGDWIQRNVIWTKRPQKAGSSGNVTPGIYGRNVVVGFTELDDGKIVILSRHVSRQYLGTDRYHLNHTMLDDWLEYMIEVPVAR